MSYATQFVVICLLCVSPASCAAAAASHAEIDEHLQNALVGNALADPFKIVTAASKDAKASADPKDAKASAVQVTAVVGDKAAAVTDKATAVKDTKAVSVVIDSAASVTDSKAPAVVGDKAAPADKTKTPATAADEKLDKVASLLKEHASKQNITPAALLEKLQKDKAAANGTKAAKVLTAVSADAKMNTTKINAEAVKKAKLKEMLVDKMHAQEMHAAKAVRAEPEKKEVHRAGGIPFWWAFPILGCVAWLMFKSSILQDFGYHAKGASKGILSGRRGNAATDWSFVEADEKAPMSNCASYGVADEPKPALSL